MMAVRGGVSEVTAGSVSPLPGQRTIDPSARKAANSSSANAGAGRREDPGASARQWINFDGQQLNRLARRGTYVNILV